MKTLFTLHGSHFNCNLHLLAFILLIFFTTTTSAQQDFAFASYSNNHSSTEIIKTDSDDVISYMQINTVEKQKGEFKDLVIKISPNALSGMMSLEINSEKERTVLIEFKNLIEDILIYQSFDLKTGNNSIPFETDDASVGSFRLTVSEANTNTSSTFLLLKN